MKIVNLNEKEHLAVLVYGKPGSGKTWFLGTACDDDRSYPVLHVDASGNPETLAKRRGKKPHVLRLESLKELNAIYDWFLKGQPENHIMVSRFGCTPGYKTLIFDGITDIQRRSFETVLGQAIQPGDIPLKAEWQHYGAVLRQMLVIARCFLQNLRDTHVLVSCLEHVDIQYTIPDNPRTAYEHAKPGLQGQTATELPGEALAVLRLAHRAVLSPDIARHFKEAHSVAQLRANKFAYAKDQHHFGGTVVGDSIYMPDPTITTLLNAIERQ